MAEIKKINTELQPIDKLLDTSGDAGTSGQILSTTGSGTNWIDNTGGSVTGTGADEQVTYWTSSSVIDGDSGFKYNKSASNIAVVTIDSITAPQLGFIETNSAYTDSMRIVRSSDKLHFTYGHNADEEAITIVGGTGSDLGYVGIKETSPQNTLHVQGTFRVGPWYATSDRDHFLVTPGGSVTTVSTPNENVNYDNSAGSTHIRTNSGYNTPVERLTVLSGGNVGIGVIDPDSRLEIKGAGGTTGLTLKTTDSLGNTGFWTQDGGATGVHYYPFVVGMDHDDAKPSSTLFYAKTASGSEGGLFVKTDGNVGIGTVLPVDNSGWGGLTLSGSTGGQIDFQDDGTTVGAIYNGTWGLAVASVSGKELRLYSSDTIALTFDTSQDATFAGVLDVNGTGSNTFAGRIVIDGSNGSNGITLLRPSDSAEMTAISAPDSSTLKIGGGNQSYVKIFAHTTEVVEFNNSGNATFAGNITFSSGSDIIFPDNNGAALEFKEGSNLYMRFITTNGSEAIQMEKATTISNSLAVNSLNVNYGALSISGDNANHATLTESGSGDFTIATVDDLRLDSGGNDIVLRGASSQEFGRLTNDDGNTVIRNITSNHDIIFKGNDGGSTITALTIDMSEAGQATWNANVNAPNFIAGTAMYANAGIYYGTSIMQLKDNGGNPFLQFDANKDATFYGDIALGSYKATSGATITGDGSTTLTTKGYVDGLIVGATIYQGTWDANNGSWWRYSRFNNLYL